MTRSFWAGLGLTLGLMGLLSWAMAPAGDKDDQEGAAGQTDYAELYSEVELGDADPLSVPVTDGIVWYGTWEDAMAEKERTGKPVMLHFGSPRCPAKGVNVPGTW